VNKAEVEGEKGSGAKTWKYGGHGSTGAHEEKIDEGVTDG